MTRNNCLKEYKGTWGAGEDLLRIFLLSFLALISDKIQGWEGGGWDSQGEIFSAMWQ